MGWTSGQKHEVRTTYAQDRGLLIFSGVPIDGPPDSTAVGLPSSAPGVREYDAGAFAAELSKVERIEVIMSWGSVDRPALGNLKAIEAFFQKRWDPKAPVLGVALVEPGGEMSNVVPAFQASGFEVIPVRLAEVADAVEDRGGGGGKDPWNHPQPGEDALLHQLWELRDREGWWLAEVPIGRGAPRRIDAVVVNWPEPRQSRQREDLDSLRAEIAKGASAELIEAKKTLNIAAIGQLEAAKVMFSEDYPGEGPLKLTACVRRVDDERLDWFCEQAGIEVVVLQDLPSATERSEESGNN